MYICDARLYNCDCVEYNNPLGQIRHWLKLNIFRRKRTWLKAPSYINFTPSTAHANTCMSVSIYALGIFWRHKSCSYVYKYMYAMIQYNWNASCAKNIYIGMRMIANAKKFVFMRSPAGWFASQRIYITELNDGGESTPSLLSLYTCINSLIK